MPDFVIKADLNYLEEPSGRGEICPLIKYSQICGKCFRKRVHWHLLTLRERSEGKAVISGQDSCLSVAGFLWLLLQQPCKLNVPGISVIKSLLLRLAKEEAPESPVLTAYVSWPRHLSPSSLTRRPKRTKCKNPPAVPDRQHPSNRFYFSMASPPHCTAGTRPCTALPHSPFSLYRPC